MDRKRGRASERTKRRSKKPREGRPQRCLNVGDNDFREATDGTADIKDELLEGSGEAPLHYRYPRIEKEPGAANLPQRVM